MIEKIVTARGPEYAVGNLVCTSNDGENFSKVTNIEFIGGDYELGSMSAYAVNLKDGRLIYIKDAVEVWHSPEPKHEPGYDARDILQDVSDF